MTRSAKIFFGVYVAASLIALFLFQTGQASPESPHASASQTVEIAIQTTPS